MKKIFLVALAFLSFPAFSAENVYGTSVSYVYQVGSEPTQFDFQSSRTNECGSSLYRVTSDDVHIANRKFSLVLAAFISGKRLAFHDTGTCAGNRALVSWVRITN